MNSYEYIKKNRVVSSDWDCLFFFIFLPLYGNKVKRFLAIVSYWLQYLATIYRRLSAITLISSDQTPNACLHWSQGATQLSMNHIVACVCNTAISSKNHFVSRLFIKEPSFVFFFSLSMFLSRFSFCAHILHTLTPLKNFDSILLLFGGVQVIHVDFGQQR